MIEPEKQSVAKIRPRDVGVPALTFFGGMFAQRVSGESSMPVETLNWIIDKGSLGLALVCLSILAWAYFRERYERTEAERQRATDQASFTTQILAVQARCEDRLALQAAEQAPILRKIAKVMAINSQVIADRVITEEQLKELGDDTPQDAIKLPPKKTGSGEEKIP